MGVTNRNSGTFVNLKIKDQAFPEFQVMSKEDGEWKVSGVGNEFTGIFVSAKISEYEYQRKMRKKLEMEFKDEDTGETYNLSVNFNSLALSIINTLSSLDEVVGRHMMFNVYSKKDNNGEDRPRIYIEIDGEKGEWKVGTDVISRIYEHHEKWEDMFNKYVKAAMDKAPSAVPNSDDEYDNVPDETPEPAIADDEPDLDDLPF